MNRISRSLTWLIVPGLLTLLIWFAYNLSNDPTVPEINFALIDGREVSLHSLAGKPVLVTFWASSCRVCLQEMPHLITLHNELSGSGLEIIGVAMPYDPPNRVLETSIRMNIPYAVAIDINGNAVKAFGDVAGTPTSFLIAPDGEIVMSHTGMMDMAKLRTLISPMLSGKS